MLYAAVMQFDFRTGYPTQEEIHKYCRGAGNSSLTAGIEAHLNDCGLLDGFTRPSVECTATEELVTGENIEACRVHAELIERWT